MHSSHSSRACTSGLPLIASTSSLAVGKNRLSRIKVLIACWNCSVVSAVSRYSFQIPKISGARQAVVVIRHQGNAGEKRLLVNHPKNPPV